MADSDKTGKAPENEAEDASSFRGALNVLCGRLGSISATDRFGKVSGVVLIIRIVVRLVVFWFVWMAVDRLFVLYWLYSALLAVAVMAVLMRIVRRLLVK